MATATTRIADLGYSTALGRIELTVPHGTKFKDLSKIIDRLPDFVAKLPRGCLQCTSGDHFHIRERLEEVIRVDLDKGIAIGH
jgi:hypothetical protein